MVLENLNIVTLPFRQVHDHIHRYRLAGRLLPKRGTFYDLGCGYGYGSQILANRLHRRIIALDRDEQALSFAQNYYAQSNLIFRVADLDELDPSPYKGAVCFEVLEHLKNPYRLIKGIQKAVGWIFLSVPCIPTMHRNKYHRHDFTVDEIMAWFPSSWGLIHFEYQDRFRTIVLGYRKKG